MPWSALCVRLGILCLSVVLITGCSHVRWQPAGPPIRAPQINDDHLLMADGYRLPLRQWLPRGEIGAVVLGIHGFNDYGNAFGALESAVVEQGNIALYAYDQRGFGGTDAPGIWAGKVTLVDDARTIAKLLRIRYPGRPIYLIGESMGAAVVLLTLAQDAEPMVDGAVLIAPAVWGSDAMPWYQRLSLWLAVRWMPGRYFSSETVSRLGKRPTDDPEVMRSLSDDPLVLKGARVDTLHGVTELMGEASKVVSVSVPIQVLYGLNDQIIPTRPVCNWLERIDTSSSSKMRFVIYPGGFHMLTRYSGSARVLADIAAWLDSPNAGFPSGEEASLHEAKNLVCYHG